MNKTVFNREALEEALALRVNGASFADIERRTGVPASTVRFHRALRRAPKSEPEPATTPRDVILQAAIDAASSYFGSPITRDTIISDRSQDRDTTAVRHWVMAWIRWHHGRRYSTPQLGRLFGCHHSTILNAERQAVIRFPDAPFSGAGTSQRAGEMVVTHG